MEHEMLSKKLISLSVAAALGVASLVLADDMAGMNMPASPAPATQPSTQPTQAIDLRNAICPVSGDKVGDSNLVEVYDGKVYHLCCPDCREGFEKDPANYAKAVAANPAKYGVK